MYARHRRDWFLDSMMQNNGASTPPQQMQPQNQQQNSWGQNMQQWGNNQQQQMMQPQMQQMGNQNMQQMGQNPQMQQMMMQMQNPMMMQQMSQNPQMQQMMMQFQQMQMQNQQQGWQQPAGPMFYAPPNQQQMNGPQSPQPLGAFPNQAMGMQQNQMPNQMPPTPGSTASDSKVNPSDLKIIEPKVVKSQLLSLAKKTLREPVGELQDLPKQCHDYIFEHEFAPGNGGIPNEGVPQGKLKGLILEACAHLLHDKQEKLNIFFIGFDNKDGGQQNAKFEAWATKGVSSIGQKVPQGVPTQLTKVAHFIQNLYTVATEDKVFTPLIIRKVLSDRVPHNEHENLCSLGEAKLKAFEEEFIGYDRKHLEHAMCDIMEACSSIVANLAEMAVAFLSQSTCLSTCKSRILAFQRYFTVSPSTGTLEVWRGETEKGFQNSDFRVVMVSDFAMMARFLDKCSEEVKNDPKPQLAIDFEGVKLSRHGALCLIQVALRSDKTLVYVIDVHVLGKQGWKQLFKIMII